MPLNKIFSRLVLIAFLVSSVISCQLKVDIEGEKEQIQAVIDRIDQAHFTKNATEFLGPNADQFYDIRSGSFQKSNKKDLTAGIQSYLDNMEFLELEKSQAPIIEISDDASMASYIGAVVVRGRLNDKPVFWVVSWQSVLRKVENQWKIISTANTEAPKESQAPVILQKVKEVMGAVPEDGSIYAKADCKGPRESFKTLLFSKQKEGRMEQQTEDGHFIIKHGPTASWSLNLMKDRFNDSLDDMTLSFVKGHEFHWLSLRPEDRLGQPVLNGFAEFNEETSFKVEFKDAMNRSVFFYYSFENYLPLGFEYPAGDEGEIVTTYFSDWKELNETKVFQKAIINEGEIKWQYDFTDIRINHLTEQDFQSKDKFIID